LLLNDSEGESTSASTIASRSARWRHAWPNGHDGDGVSSDAAATVARCGGWSAARARRGGGRVEPARPSNARSTRAPSSGEVADAREGTTRARRRPQGRRPHDDVARTSGGRPLAASRRATPEPPPRANRAPCHVACRVPLARAGESGQSRQSRGSHTPRQRIYRAGPSRLGPTRPPHLPRCQQIDDASSHASVLPRACVAERREYDEGAGRPLSLENGEVSPVGVGGWRETSSGDHVSRDDDMAMAAWWPPTYVFAARCDESAQRLAAVVVAGRRLSRPLRQEERTRCAGWCSLSSSSQPRQEERTSDFSAESVLPPSSSAALCRRR